MPTQTINLDWSAGNNSLSKPITITADGEANIEVTVADAAVDLPVMIAIDVSALKLLYLSSDQDLTIKTNDSGTPTDTLTVSGGKPLVWFEQNGYTNPLSADVTAIYVSNSSGSPAKLIIKTLQDATP